MRLIKALLPICLVLLTSGCANDQLLKERDAIHEAFHWCPTPSDESIKLNKDERALVKDLYARITPNMTELQKCETISNSLWSLAKADNLEAREHLSRNMGWGGFSLRGPLTNEKDGETYLRDLHIVMIHSVGSRTWIEEAEKNRTRYLYSPSEDMIKFNNFMYFSDTKLQNCAEKNPSPACATLAVERGYVPSFENFTAEIEREAPDGIHLACLRREEERVKQNAHEQSQINKPMDESK